MKQKNLASKIKSRFNFIRFVKYRFRVQSRFKVGWSRIEEKVYGFITKLIAIDIFTHRNFQGWNSDELHHFWFPTMFHQEEPMIQNGWKTNSDNLEILFTWFNRLIWNKTNLASKIKSRSNFIRFVWHRFRVESRFYVGWSRVEE